jgi:hypothetical protein
MLGIGMAPLFLIFLSDSQFLNPVFLFGLGISAFAFFVLGVFILKKSR